MRDACWEELRVSGFSLLLVLGVPKKLSGGSVTAAKLFSHRGPAVTTKERAFEREVKEKERERRALLRYVGWPVSFDIFVFDMVDLWNEGVPSFLVCRLLVFIALRKFSMR